MVTQGPIDRHKPSALIPTSLSYGRENYARYPTPKSPSLRFFRTKNETVKTTLVHKGQFLPTTKGVDKTDTLFIILQSSRNIPRIRNAKGIANVSPNKPTLPILKSGPKSNRVIMKLGERNRDGDLVTSGRKISTSIS